VDTSSHHADDSPDDAAEWAAAWVARSQADGEPSGPSGGLLRVCLAATSGLALMGSAIRLAASGEDGVAASSDAAARLLAELQFDANEGPGHEALRRRRPVLVPDVPQAAVRWPGFAQVAAARGLGAVFSFPLHEGAVWLGVLELYDGRPRRLTVDETAKAAALAHIATQLLLDPQGSTGPGDLEPGVSTSLERAVVYQAQGMVMVDLGVTLAVAMVRMRGRAFADGQSLDELARRIVDGGESADSWWDAVDGDHSPGGTGG
jgi:GAF domain-containing protein